MMWIVGFRQLITNNLFRAIGRLGVATTILEGYYDITIEIEAAIDATSINDCGCEK